MTEPPLPLPETMMAIVCAGAGGSEVLIPTRVPVPLPEEDQVLIKVAGAGVNRPDILQRQGLYAAPKGHSPILGLEVAGEVVVCGSGTGGESPGMSVMALVNGGGYAEYCIAEKNACMRIPNNLSLVEAAGIPETFFTVYHNVSQRGAMKSGDWFLVHGGTSGIGVTAIQYAKACGARVIATAGSAAKCDACRALGADRAIDYTREDFVAVIKAETGGHGADVILDMVGGDYIARNIQAAAEDGRIVNIAYQKGSSATVDFMRVMLKRLTLTGSTLRVRSRMVKGEIRWGVERYMLDYIRDGKMRVVVDSTFPLAQAAEAHRRMESGEHIGKIILTMTD